MATTIRPWEPLADPDSGRLGRPSISDEMPVPDSIEGDGSEIVFDFTSNIRGVRPPLNLLERFLTADTDVAVIRFAKRFGPLAVFPSEDEEFSWPDPQRLSDLCDPHHEQLATWRRYQEQMNTVLALSAALREDQTPTIEDLDSFNQSVGGVFLQPKTRELAAKSANWRRGLAQRAGLFYTRALANACRLIFALRLNRKGQMETVFQDAVGNRPGGGLSLCGALTVQLMMAFAGTSLSLCSSCGQAYFPKRRPAVGRNRYCPRCGIRASWRDSKKKLRK